MKIESPLTGLLSQYDSQVKSERAAQDLFSEILMQAGQEGYLSAEVNLDNSPTGEAITECWRNWLSATRGSRYSEFPSAEETLDDFSALMIQAYEAGAYAAPQAFLNQLNKSQLETIQTVHHLANPIITSELSTEGALNLLLPPPAQVDLNHDGLTQSGMGSMIKFPDSRTPAAVADAWYEATASLSPQERALRQLQMKMDVLLANIHVDASVRFTHRSEPGDADWVNPMENVGYSFLDKSQQALDSLEYFRPRTPPEQYARDHKFWSEFQTALLAHDAS